MPNESTKTGQPLNENPSEDPGQNRSDQERLAAEQRIEKQRVEEQRLVHREEHQKERQQKNHSGGGRFITILIVFVLGIAATLFFLRLASTGGALSNIASLILDRTLSYNTSAPSVIDKIQRLQRIETVSYSVDTVVEGKHTNTVLPDLLFGDRILLVVHGQAIAGVDLSKLKPENVHVNGRSVTIDLPPSELFQARIDNTKTRVYARTTGMLVQADPNLEGDTRAVAEDQIRQAAINDGILDTARQNAQSSVQTMLSGIGFTQVTVK